MSAIIAGDAFKLLPTLGKFPGAFTSIPDADEVGGDIDVWRPMFYGMAVATLDALEDNAGAVFYQTDRRVNGGLESKVGMLIDAAFARGFRPMWHKVAVRSMGTNLYRPNYSHLIAFGRGDITAGKATPDVFMQGKKNYPNATDEVSLEVAYNWITTRGMARIIDPFCGRGSIGRAGRRRGVSVTSIDIDPEQVIAATAYIGEEDG